MHLTFRNTCHCHVGDFYFLSYMIVIIFSQCVKILIIFWNVIKLLSLNCIKLKIFKMKCTKNPPTQFHWILKLKDIKTGPKLETYEEEDGSGSSLYRRNLERNVDTCGMKWNKYKMSNLQHK